jgi:uncharacterized SAM-binding protein YcdF (DUF218 family)
MSTKPYVFPSIQNSHFFIFSIYLDFHTFIFALFSKKPNRKRNFTIITIVILLLFSNEFLLNEVLLKWETKSTGISNEKFDYVIVLGGFSSYDTSLNRVQLTGAGDRIWQTLSLYNQKKVRKIFISGGSGKLLHSDETEADKVKNYLSLLNIPEKDIITEALSRNTYENAKYTTDWIKKHDPSAKCLLITSACHMKRAYACFKKLDPKITQYPVNFMSHPRIFDLDILIKPNAKTLYNWDILLKEMVGYYIYKVVGYN